MAHSSEVTLLIKFSLGTDFQWNLGEKYVKLIIIIVDKRLYCSSSFPASEMVTISRLQNFQAMDKVVFNNNEVHSSKQTVQ